METRVGLGTDVHRLVPGRPFLLGGVLLASDVGPEGHSDADPLLHALIDALLGAAGRGDIGEHFPDSDPRWRGADSRDLLARAVETVSGDGWRVGNADLTVVTERPRLGPAKAEIRRSVAALLGVAEDRVNVKAKTREGLDAVGEGRAVEALAVVLIERGEP